MSDTRQYFICIFFHGVYDTRMANQRKKGVERITLTLPDELLQQVEAEVQATGNDRLTVIRAAIADYLSKKATPPPKSGSSAGSKKKKPSDG